MDAAQLLEANFLQASSIVALDGRADRNVLHRAPDEGISGGQTYHAIILACALKARAGTLITFNTRRFLPLVKGRIDIVTPV